GAVAQDVTLTSRDGTVSVSGTLLTFDGELYRLETEYGVLTLDGLRVTCDGPGCPDLTGLVSKLRISGSRTMGEVLMPALVETYAIRNNLALERQVISDTAFEYRLTRRGEDTPAAIIGFRITSTAEGFADLVADEADLVLSTREVTPTEIELGRAAGLGDLSVARRSQIVALDGLVPIVSRRNPLDAILLEDLAQVYAGQIVDWVALGGTPGPLSLHLRDTQSGLAEEFRRRVMAPMGLDIVGDVTLHADNASLADAVSRDPDAIGIAAFSETGNAKMLDLIGSCGKRIRASSTTLKTEDYPLTTPLFIYSPIGRPSPLTRELIGYIRSRFAQPVIARSGFVDLRVGEVNVDGQGQRLANAIGAAGDEITLTELQRLVAELDGTERLTLSFRFEPGGTRLDAQSRSNIEQLGRVLEDGRLDDREIMFVGFTDGEGEARANLRLARRRADTVRKAVLRAAPAADHSRLNISVEAFGEAMPMACDDSAWGKAINRRVEVWVK
ncbi:MAG: substrate-binding domain-containing protein, partial [Pseudomonadota bacterium]